jgi:biopolymer transport protein ExbB
MLKKIRFITTKFKVALLLLASSSLSLEAASTSNPKATAASLDLAKVFQGSPVIYSVLLVMSLFAFSLWMYSIFTLRTKEVLAPEFIDEVRDHFLGKRYEAALEACNEEGTLAAKVIASGIAARRHGQEVIMSAMQAEGKRCAASLWQRISLLNDVAMTAPMLGLLGTVLGMFYAFYDTNHITENLSAIFDGLGVAIGTTVAGLVVAIVATLFHTILKFRIVRLLNRIEDEALAVGNLIETENPKST